MATYPKIDRAKQWLDTSNLKQTNMPLWQVISALIDAVRLNQVATQEVAAESGGGGSSAGITELTTDVVAVGPGIAAATIQPDAVTTAKILDANVTYPKIQDTVLGDILLGRSATPGTVEEIELGADLEIVDTTLQIIPGGGGSGGGIAHDFLSATHPDTVPDSPVIGDLVRAVEGPGVTGEYYGFILNAPVVEDIQGFRMGYVGPPEAFIGNFFGYYPPAFDFVPVTPPDTLLAFEYTDFFIQSLLVEDIEGFRTGYAKTFDYLVGNNFGYYAPAFAFVVPPSPANPDAGALWERLPVGAEGDVLTVVDGVPEWTPLPVSQIPIVCPWETIPFDSANFTASGGVGPTWTVDAADVERMEYQVFSTPGDANNSVRIAVYLRNTTVGGTAPDQLHIQLPFNVIGEFAQIIGLQENSVAQYDCFVSYSGTTSILNIQKIPFGGSGPVFDTTADETFLSFEISARTDLEGCFVETAAVGGVPYVLPVETGTWTPAIGGSGGQSGQTYLMRNGYYWKLDKFVWVSGLVILSAKGTITGAVEIQGLPFSAQNVTNYRTSAAVNWANLNLPVNVVQGFMLPATSVLGLFYADGAGVTTVQQFIDADLLDTSVFGFGFGYLTD